MFPSPLQIRRRAQRSHVTDCLGHRTLADCTASLAPNGAQAGGILCRELGPRSWSPLARRTEALLPPFALQSCINMTIFYLDHETNVTKRNKTQQKD